MLPVRKTCRVEEEHWFLTALEIEQYGFLAAFCLACLPISYYLILEVCIACVHYLGWPIPFSDSLPEFDLGTGEERYWVRVRRRHLRVT